jgi:RNA polymerase sigma-70 factor (ECF subfamily)
MPEAHHPDLDDADLIKQAKSGSTRAFGILYERYALSIYRFLRAQLQETLAAEDLTSEVFLKAWDALPRYRERGYPFSSFLFRVARNTVIDYQRKRIKEITESQRLIDFLPNGSPAVSDQMVRDQTHEGLWKLLDEIGDGYRSVLVLRFINGLSIAEIAKILKRSQGAVRVLQHRGLKALREKIEQSGDTLW